MGQEMNWLLAPSADGLNEEQWAYWDGAFTDEELEKLHSTLEAMEANVEPEKADREFHLIISGN